MIYFVFLLYILFLVIVYDIKGRTKKKQLHFRLALLFLILIGGLRYRLGTDTVMYMDSFEYYPRLSNLTYSDFLYFRYQPLWIVLNCIGRSLGNFVYVQLITAGLHIGIMGHALKKICPSMIFSSLFFYYLFDFTRLNMEVMREALAIALFLLFILAINEKRIWKALFCITIATGFHIFALPIYLIYWLYYKFFARTKVLNFILLASILILCVTNKSFMADGILNYLSIENGGYSEAIVSYANSEKYGGRDYNLIGILYNLIRPCALIALLLVFRKECKKYILIDEKLFVSAIWLASIFLLCKFSMPIMERPYNYVCIFTCILYSIFYAEILSKTKTAYRLPLQMGLLIISVTISLHNYFGADRLVETEHFYSRYYPYSSVFDKTIDNHREHIFGYRY